jgi:ubiquinone/menaquinone biosynthesis C-methylase UbiE
MKQKDLYSAEDITKTYEKVHDLLLTRYIIKSYSTNRSDVREIAVKNLNLANVKKVLELGCGYGFFIEKLKGMLHDSAIIIGIDMVENNREPFLHSVASIQYKGEFIQGNADIIKEMSKSSFDLIITSYSLYFFPHLIPNIADILSPDGIFIAITHSKKTLQEAIYLITECMSKIGIEKKDETIINKLFMAFSLEDGKEQLERYYEKVERIHFMNSMIFHPGNIDDCIFYINQKKNLIYKEVMESMPEKMNELQQCVERNIQYQIHTMGIMSLNKNDAVFRCYKPKR